MIYLLTLRDSGYEISGPVPDDTTAGANQETFDNRTDVKTRADEWVTNNV